MHLRACLKKNPVETKETQTPTDPKEPPIQTTVPDPVETPNPTEHKESIGGTKNDSEEFTGFFV